MRNTYSVILKGVLVIVVLLSGFGANSFNSIKLNAVQSDSKSIDLVIDDGAAEINASFDKVDRFSKDGIAIIGKTYEANEENDEGIKKIEKKYKYGLINYKGEVILDPIYDEIKDYDENYYSIINYEKNNGYRLFDLKGIASKKSGEILIEPIYSEISDFTNQTIVTLQESIETNCEGPSQEDMKCYSIKEVLKSNKNGVFSDIVAPDNVRLDKYDWISVKDFSADVKFISGHYEVEDGEKSFSNYDNWLVDQYGNSISDVMSGYITGYINYNGEKYISFNEQTSESFLDSFSTLYLMDISDEKVQFNTVMGPKEGFTYVHINKYTNVAYYQREIDNKRTSGNYTFDMKKFEEIAYPEGPIFTVGKYTVYQEEQDIYPPADAENNQIIAPPNEQDYYSTKDNGEHNVYGARYGLKDENDNVIVPIGYFNIEYDEILNILLLHKQIDTVDIDNKLPIETLNVIDMFSLKEDKIIAENVLNNDFDDLKYRGYSEFSVSTGYYQKFEPEDDWTSPLTKSGVMSKYGDILLDPVYDEVISFERIYPNMINNEAIFSFSEFNSKDICYNYNKYDDEDINDEKSEYECTQKNIGIFNALNAMDNIENGSSNKKEFILQSNDVNELYGFDSEGYAITGKSEFKTDSGTHMDEKLGKVNWAYKHLYNTGYGLVHIEKGEILYTEFDDIDKDRSGKLGWGGATPNFDEDNHIKVFKKKNEAEQLTGIANKDGIVIEAKYEDAYYKNSNYYVTTDNENWIIKNVDESNALRNIKFDTPVESIELLDDKVVAKLFVEDGFIGNYSYGMVNAESSELLLNYEYSDISFDGIFWYLEKYDENLNIYSKAVMDRSLNIVIPFDSEYDVLSEYISGYAIGQKGQKDVRHYLSNDSINTISAFAIGTEDFKLEVVDINGDIVGDLSEKFESASLLGEFNDQIKALVKQNGKLYIANLVEVDVIPPTEEPEVPSIPVTPPVESEEEKPVEVPEPEIKPDIDLGEKEEKTGWVKEDSKWYYYNDDNEVHKGWLKAEGTWYYMDDTGTMQSGWAKINNTWYFMNNSGAMQTGWAKVKDTWYYMSNSGAMQSGWTKVKNTWYYMSNSGAMQSGWTKVNDTWYFMNNSGAMQTGWAKVGNAWYYMSSSGAMQIGWEEIDNTWYYLNKGGSMKTGWLKLNNSWYYLNPNGSMKTGRANIEGKIYYFNQSGRLN